LGQEGLDDSDMPAHIAGSVTVKVVSLGIAGSGLFTYNPGPALLFPAPPDGEVNVAYSDQLTVTGGTSPYTWSVSTGTLPPGLTLGASTGLLAGTPTTVGTYSFTVKVTDQSGLTDTVPVTMTIIAGPSLNFPAPPPGWTHTVYGDTLTATGGTTPYSWSVSAGTLPAGITLNASTGVLAGTPTVAGTSSFTIKVTDASSRTATKAASITIAAGPLTITVPSSAALPSASPGGNASAQLGTVTVNDLRGMATASWTATVTATTFVTGGATAAETIPLTQITYWSGPATVTTGTGTFTPGQASPAVAVNLTVPRVAFTLTTGSSVNSVSWTPTLSVSVPAAAVAGTYTATITHSVS
jgi:putative Ig domain-containing protein